FNVLIVYSPHAILRFYDVNNWKQLGEIRLAYDNDNYCLFDDYKNVAIYRTRQIDPFESDVHLGIKAYSCTNGQLLWNWKGSENTGVIHAILPNESTRRFVCQYASWGGASFRCNSISFDGTDATPIVYTLPYEPRTDNGPPLQILIKKGEYSLSLMYSYEEKERFILRDDKTFETMCEFTAGNSNIRCLLIDKSVQFAAGIVDNNALAIWTRRREHFEWWGIYEQLEFWVAVLFFGALIWSVRRDWAERNGVGQGVKQTA
ncbi:MAG: hypothetical protein WCT04_21690, partial [Planctomycetota bacterium]